jgi:hypothetical protein
MTILAGIITQKELWIGGEDPLDGKPISTDTDITHRFVAESYG